MKLRSYQEDAYDSTLAKFEGTDSVLCVMATGLGKTIYFAHIANHFRKTGRIMVVAHREELIFQAQEKMHLVTGVEADVEMGQEWAGTGWYKSDIVVSTVQTQIAGREGGRMERFDPNDFSLLVIDEAHHAPAATYKRIIEYYKKNPNLKILGVTATADRLDSKAMGQVFNDVAFKYDIRDGVDDGWLVPIEQRSVFVSSLDYSEVKSANTADGLNGKDLAKVLEYEENIHAIADPTVKLTGDKKTLIFAASLAQAERLTEIINRHKPHSARFVYGKTPKEIRRAMFKEYAEFNFQYLVNVGVLTEGFDDPSIQCIVLARPTKSRSFYTQMVGRGTRPLTGIVDIPKDDLGRRAAIAASGKPNLEVIDFVGNAGRHKLITVADVLGGKYDDDVVELAAKNAADDSARTGKPADVATELEKAEREIAHRKSIEEDGDPRKNIKIGAYFTSKKVNPFDVFDITPYHVENPQNHDRPASTKQTAYLKSKGVNTDKLSKTHASQLIDTLVKRDLAGCCSFKQIKLLRRWGFPQGLTKKQAGPVMGALSRIEWGRGGRKLPASVRQGLINRLREQGVKC